MLIEEYLCGLVAVKILEDDRRREGFYVELDKLTYKDFLSTKEYSIEGKIVFPGGLDICEITSLQSGGRFVVKFQDLTKHYDFGMSSSWKEFYETFSKKNEDKTVRMSFASKPNNTQVRVIGNEFQIRKELDSFLTTLRENAPFLKKVI